MLLVASARPRKALASPSLDFIESRPTRCGSTEQIDRTGNPETPKHGNRGYWRLPRLRSSCMSSSSISNPSRRRAKRSWFLIVTPVSAYRRRSCCITYSGTLVDRDVSGERRRDGSMGAAAKSGLWGAVSVLTTRTLPSFTPCKRAAWVSNSPTASNRGSFGAVLRGTSPRRRVVGDKSGASS
jgi:hypothetical protein